LRKPSGHHDGRNELEKQKDAEDSIPPEFPANYSLPGAIRRHALESIEILVFYDTLCPVKT